jgi:hypothetical protein
VFVHVVSRSQPPLPFTHSLISVQRRVSAGEPRPSCVTSAASNARARVAVRAGSAIATASRVAAHSQGVAATVSTRALVDVCNGNSNTVKPSTQLQKMTAVSHRCISRSLCQSSRLGSHHTSCCRECWCTWSVSHKRRCSPGTHQYLRATPVESRRRLP